MPNRMYVSCHKLISFLDELRIFSKRAYYSYHSNFIFFHSSICLLVLEAVKLTLQPEKSLKWLNTPFNSVLFFFYVFRLNNFLTSSELRVDEYRWEKYVLVIPDKTTRLFISLQLLSCSTYISPFLSHRKDCRKYRMHLEN